MKAIVGEKEIYEKLKNTKKETITKDELIEIIKKMYYKKTGKACTTPTALEKIRNLEVLGKIEKVSENVYKVKI